MSLKANRLELTFQTAELREICEKRDVAAAKLGYAAARELADRLADMEALDHVADLCTLFGKAVCDRGSTEKVFRLSTGFEVIFVSGHRTSDNSEQKDTDWGNTRRIKIMAIEAADG